MPVWHKATRQWVGQGRLALLGITQEQHADRCRLFAQWHQFGWPILHDSINVMESRAVPIVIAIDEHGIVRSVRPRVETFKQEFLDKEFRDDGAASSKTAVGAAGRPPAGSASDLAALRRQAQKSGSARAWRQLGDGLAIWGGPGRINEAIAAYARAVKLDPKDGNALFRLGVCYRMRHESGQASPRDFQEAVDYWSRARAIDPNQYIWRRRIEQYGPRLIKPYPFYDWTERAVSEITARGERPVPLAVQPYGAEIARPAPFTPEAAHSVQSPDPEGRILRDSGLIDVEVAVVPRRIRPGRPARVHVTFRPNAQRKAYWNNEAEPLRLWIESPSGWEVSQHLLSAPQGTKPETKEVRRVDFEAKAPGNAAGAARLTAYALYYVCEDLDGTCQFLRQDIDINMEVAK